MPSSHPCRAHAPLSDPALTHFKKYCRVAPSKSGPRPMSERTPCSTSLSVTPSISTTPSIVRSPRRIAIETERGQASSSSHPAM